jgi:hypothetical protein
VYPAGVGVGNGVVVLEVLQLVQLWLFFDGSVGVVLL